LERDDEHSGDLTPKDGERVTQPQVTVQVWRDGKIARETFDHG